MHPIQLRPPNSTDINFIYGSWLESYAASQYCPIPGNSYYYYQKLLITHIINNNLITVICNPEDNDQIYGYAVYSLTADTLVLHWIYIKLAFRKLGFAKYLLSVLSHNNKQIVITHKGLDYDSVSSKFPHTWLPKAAF